MNATPVVSPNELRDFRMDGWLVQPRLSRLVAADRAIHVRPQLIDLLTCLAHTPGAVVSKGELLSVVWSDRCICESGVARCVAELRSILADDARRPRIIETIPKRGYRLIARVEHGGEPAAPTASSAWAAASAPSPPPARAVGFGIRARAIITAAAGLLAAWRH